MTTLEFQLVDSVPDGAQLLLASDVINHYWVVSPTPAEVASNDFALAVNTSEFEPKVLLTESGLAFLGVEQGIFCVQPASGSIIAEITDLTFLQAIDKISNDRVLVSAEDELLLFEGAGALVWRCNLPSIIENVVETERGIEVEMDDGENVFLSVETGRSIS